MEMDLQIHVRDNAGIAIVELTGEVDAYTSARFREILLGVIEDDNVDLIVSMMDVEYIDSSGLGALVGGLKRVSEKNGQIFIVCESNQVKKVFEITGLEKVFPIYPTESEAIAAINNKQ